MKHTLQFGSGLQQQLQLNIALQNLRLRYKFHKCLPRATFFHEEVARNY
jgi:hypothetical protein